MAAHIKPYPFNPTEYPDEAQLPVESGTPIVDVETMDQIDRVVRAGYTAHTEGDNGHAFLWQERGKFKVVSWRTEAEGPARRLNFLAIEDAAEYFMTCVK